MTVGLSAPDAALVHGFRGGEEDGGEADNPETDEQRTVTRIQWCLIRNSTKSTRKFHFHNV